MALQTRPAAHAAFIGVGHAILTQHMPRPEGGVYYMPHDANVEQYRAALRNHDWSFEFSEDQDAWRRGRREREALINKQRVYDPDYAIWNEVAPIDYRVKKG